MSYGQPLNSKLKELHIVTDILFIYITRPIHLIEVKNKYRKYLKLAYFINSN